MRVKTKIKKMTKMTKTKLKSKIKAFAERIRISEPEKKDFLDFIKKNVTENFAEDFVTDKNKSVRTEKYIDEHHKFQKDYTQGSRMWMRDQLEEYCENFLRKRKKETDSTDWDEIFNPDRAYGDIEKDKKKIKSKKNKLLAALKKIIADEIPPIAFAPENQKKPGEGRSRKFKGKFPSKEKRTLEKPKSVDFSDNESVIAEIVYSFWDGEEDPTEIGTEIEDSFAWNSPEISGTFTARGDDFAFIVNEDEAISIAKESVKDSMDSDPQAYEVFLKSYVFISDTDRSQIANEEASSYIEGQSTDDILTEADMADEYDEIDSSEEYTDVEKEAAKQQLAENAIDKVRDKYYEEAYDNLADPVEYFTGQGMDVSDVLAMNFIQINYDSAAEDLISSDGWAPALSRYDGGYETTTNGIVYFLEG